MYKNDIFCLNLKEIKEIIVDDVRIQGRSDGWLLDTYSHNQLENMLNQYDIDYKYLGVWGNKKLKTA